MRRIVEIERRRRGWLGRCRRIGDGGREGEGGDDGGDIHVFISPEDHTKPLHDETPLSTSIYLGRIFLFFYIDFFHGRSQGH
jgi:hypothetical protein